MDKQVLLDTLQLWFTIGEKLNWTSYDRFDILASPLLQPLQSISPLASRVLIQFGKRLGTGARRYLGIQPSQEAKTLSDFLSAAAVLGRSGETWSSRFVETLITRLMARAIPGVHGLGWGLEFPYTSRFVNAPARTPNAYQTVNAAQALLDSYRSTGDPEAFDCALAGCRFVVEDLGDFEYCGQQWFQYWPKRNIPAPNIQALICSLFAAMARYQEGRFLGRLADRCATTLLAVQRPDGSWPYSVDGRANFIDAFHTGFILQGLAEYISCRGQDALPVVKDSLERGLLYFRKHLMTDKKMPRAYADGPPSYDGQALAQHIQTLIVCGGEVDVKTAYEVWIELDGRFTPRLAVGASGGGPGASARVLDLRWTIGPSVLATSHLVRKILGVSLVS